VFFSLVLGLENKTGTKMMFVSKDKKGLKERETAREERG
jgi:predicted component of viral defense system (DUF524 family)